METTSLHRRAVVILLKGMRHKRLAERTPAPPRRNCDCSPSHHVHNQEMGGTMKWRALLLLAPFAVMAGCDQGAVSPTEPLVAPQLAAVPAHPAGGRDHGALGAVYVSSQGLYYDTFVTVQELPRHGRFQKLETGVTEFGPGDAGYLAGRWWVDVNGNGYQDEGDDFLLCPLLPPGYPEM
jgi:hypothetical protein